MEQSISLFIEVKILIVCTADLRKSLRVMKIYVMSGFKIFCLKYLINYYDYYVKKYFLLMFHVVVLWILRVAR